MKNYYQILLIPDNATKTEIKKAYRKLALKYHPDRNKEAYARDKFMEITEAYEMLLSPEYKTSYYTEAQEDAIKNAQRRAQQKAYAYARMKEKEFKNSDVYKRNQAELYILDQLHLYSAYFMLFIMPPLSYFIWDLQGLAWSGGILFVSWAYWTEIFITDSKINFKNFRDSFKLVARTNGFQIGLLIVFSIYVIFTSFTNAIIPHLYFIAAICIWCFVFLLIYFAYIVQDKPKSRLGFAFSIPIASLMLILFLNNLFSRNAFIEAYPFERSRQTVSSNYSSHVQQTTYIYLPHNKYEDELGLRLFPDQDKLANNNWIVYGFETGLFGIKVLKNYHFEFR